eukprot:5023746-Amphidinium_carterae.2
MRHLRDQLTTHKDLSAEAKQFRLAATKGTEHSQVTLSKSLKGAASASKSCFNALSCSAVGSSWG